MKGTRLELDKVRHLRFDFNAMAEFDEVNATSFIETIETGKISHSTMRNLLWAGLLHENADITPDEVGDLVQKYWIEKQGKSFLDIFPILKTAFIDSGLVNSDDTKEDNNKKKAKFKKKRSPQKS